MNTAKNINTAVVLVIFNRPNTTQEVFNVLKEVKPKKLFVIADGPRVNNQEDIRKCQEARNIINTISWECEVHKRYADTNIGIRNNFPDGLNWVFGQVNEAIILEDDTVPHPSFFPYCEELLEHYKDDERIGMISGYNSQYGITRGKYSYYFSNHTHIGGWATWKRAWKYYDVNSLIWSELSEDRYFDNIVTSEDEKNHWIKSISYVLNNKNPGWDAQWSIAMWSQNMLTILPNTNLIKNIGFDNYATHTTNPDNIVNSIPTKEIVLPLLHPNIIVRNRQADTYSAKILFTTSLPRRLIRRLLGKKLINFMQFYQKIPF